MAAENIYQNDMAPAPPLHPKRGIPVVSLLAVLVLLLGISLVAVTILHSQKETKVQEQEGLIEKLRCYLKLSNFSHPAGDQAERDLLGFPSRGWKIYEQGFYFFSQEKTTWWEAEKDYGAHLTSVTSQEEMQYLLEKAENKLFWIGLTDIPQPRGKNRVWTWTDGTKYSKNASFWKEGQPSNPNWGTETCVWFRNDLKSWNDDPCTRERNWICKLVCT